MSEDISLCDLVNLSIGTPEVGAVNFTALHTLLHAMLGQLGIREVKTRWTEAPHGQTPAEPPLPLPAPYLRIEDKLRQIEKHIAMVEELPTGAELLERTASSSSSSSSSNTPVNDMWRLMQLRSRIQTNEDGVSRAMALVQDLLKEIHSLKEFRDNLKKEINEFHHQLERIDVGGLAERVTAVEKCCHHVEELKETTRSLRETVQQYPDPEELDQCVTWDAMQSALLSERENLQKELAGSGTIDQATVAKPAATPHKNSLTPVASVPSDTSVSSSSPPAKPSAPGSPTIPGKPLSSSRRLAPQKPSTPPLPSPSNNTYTGAASFTLDSRQEDAPPAQGEAPPAPEAPPVPSAPPQQTRSDTGLTAVGMPLTRVASGARCYPETLEALRNIGKLKDRHNDLEARVAALEAGKADQAQLVRLKKLITNTGARELPDNLMDQLNHQRALIDSLMSDREKLDSLEEMFMNIGSQGRENAAEASEASENVDSESIGFHQLRQQTSYLRRVVQKLEEDMKQLKGRGASSGQKTTDHLQDQLDDLRGMLEDMMVSSSSLLSRSLQDEAGQDEAGQDEAGQDESGGQGQAGPALATSSVDIGRKLSLLFLRYEKLQDAVSGVLQQQTGGRAEALQDTENVELMSDVQRAILQLQAECEKLHETTRCLVEDNSQKQSHIEQLYKSMEELEEKKADKQLVEMEIEIKADKCALESKVSRLQFDSMTEQLSTMFHELLSKVTGQEQDWHKVIDKLSTEMECKLNRIELDSVKTQLEDRWKSIHKKLQAQPAPEHEDAAGIRKQLVARFHCISCDRPVDMHTSGPHLVTVPSTPGLPSHKSNRPYTVYALEQVRQHYRSLKPGTNLCNYGIAHSDRSMVQLHKIHTAMCKQIERVQSRLKCPDWSNNRDTVRETASRHPPILSVVQTSSHSRTRHERIPEMSDYSYLAVSRSCGGSHTLTSPSRRYTRLQHITHFFQTEVDGQPLSASPLRFQPEEVDILGLDGHIYKGRLNTRDIRNTDAKLPTISPKDGMCRSKDKAKRPPSQKSVSPEAGHGSPVHPHSAKSQRSRSASSSSVRDWPVSPLGSASQSSFTQALAPADSDLCQEEEPVTNL